VASSSLTAVYDAFIQAAKDLGQAELEFALVGGLAVSARGAPRFTADVDFAIAVSGDEAAEAAVFRMQRLGYLVQTTIEDKLTGRLSTARLVGVARPRVVVDLLFNACGVESEVVAQATLTTLLPGVQVPVARAGHLLAMKVLALDDKRRPQDRMDVASLLPHADSKERALARAALERIQALGKGRGKKLVALFDRLAAAHPLATRRSARR
jgi:predicted nucleotidyltransferase